MTLSSTCKTLFNSDQPVIGRGQYEDPGDDVHGGEHDGQAGEDVDPLLVLAELPQLLEDVVVLHVASDGYNQWNP